MPDQNPEFDLPTPEELVELLPGYSQIEFFAQGGMAAIYKGLQTSLDRQVAIKVLPREYGNDEAFRLRFEAEGKAMAKLNHPNLVSIFDFGEVDGLLYIVMEFVPGETLFTHAYGSPLPQLEAITFARQVAEGLAHAHELGILHRDIKPANVLLDAKGIPKLGDFGLAEGEERAAGDDLVFGTPGYTSPEVMADPGNADEKADIFAVGVMLYELLTTKLPEAPYQPPSRLVSGNFRTDAVVQKAIQQDPAQRYATAADLATALKSLEDHLSNHSGRAFAIATANGEAATDSPATRPTTKRRVGPDFNLLRNLIIIAGLGLAIFVTHKALQSRKSDVLEKQAEIDKEIELSKRKKAAQQAALQKLNNGSGSQSSDLLTRNDLKEDSNPNGANLIPDAAVVPEPVVELSPAEELEKLRIALADGDRSQFPKSTVERAGSHFFFVEEAMTWHKALTFAEEHGAHLAIPVTKSDLRWMGQELPDGTEQFWLGGGAVVRTSWSWLDPEMTFDMKEPSMALGTAATGTNFGILKGAQPKAVLPFYIQWHSDGSNPGDLENQLIALQETISESTPRWPAGTLAMDESRYLFVGRAMTFEEAESFAQSQSGHLAVASSEIEAAFIRDMAALSGLEAVWIGGKKSVEDWSWVSGEPWNFARWGDNFPIDDPARTALTVTSQGWENRSPAETTAGFLIEWSDDAAELNTTDTPGTSQVAVANNELLELRTLAEKLIATELSVHIKKMDRNTKSQGSFMRSWLRGIAQSDAIAYNAAYELYKPQINFNTGRLPAPTVVPAGTFPLKATEILDRHFKLQQSYDFELEAASERIRAAYVARIEAKAKELEEMGLKAKVASLRKEIEGVGTSGKEFLAHFQFTPFGVAEEGDVIEE